MGKVERSVGTVLVLFMRVKSVATQMVQNPTSMGNATRVKRVDTEGVIMVGRIAPRFGICQFWNFLLTTHTLTHVL